MLCTGFMWGEPLLATSALPSDASLKQMIARMLIVGFDAKRIDANTSIAKEISTYSLGGVILFDRDFTDRSRTKNIDSPKQLYELTYALHSLAQKPLLICVDQEGGKVARLKPHDGFAPTPSAHAIAKLEDDAIKVNYQTLAATLHDHGITCNFAPVLDLARNPKNPVIAKLERSYGEDPLRVVHIANTLITEQSKHGVISVAKHFPGHGSSLEDSHKGFVDITHTWDKVELEPYKALIAKDALAMVMSAHVFHAGLDPLYPATLSHAINTTLLRDSLHFTGVLVSDDMQMGAVVKHFTLKESVTLAINSGVDMLLFGNQLGHHDTQEIIDLILKGVKNGEILYARIVESNKRIEAMHKNFSTSRYDIRKK